MLEVARAEDFRHMRRKQEHFLFERRLVIPYLVCTWTCLRCLKLRSVQPVHLELVSSTSTLRPVHHARTPLSRASIILVSVNTPAEALILCIGVRRNLEPALLFLQELTIPVISDLIILGAFVDFQALCLLAGTKGISRLVMLERLDRIQRTPVRGIRLLESVESLVLSSVGAILLS